MAAFFMCLDDGELGSLETAPLLALKELWLLPHDGPGKMFFEGFPAMPVSHWLRMPWVQTEREQVGLVRAFWRKAFSADPATEDSKQQVRPSVTDTMASSLARTGLCPGRLRAALSSPIGPQYASANGAAPSGARRAAAAGRVFKCAHAFLRNGKRLSAHV